MAGTAALATGGQSRGVVNGQPVRLGFFCSQQLSTGYTNRTANPRKAHPQNQTQNPNRSPSNLSSRNQENPQNRPGHPSQDRPSHASQPHRRSYRIAHPSSGLIRPHRDRLRTYAIGRQQWRDSRCRRKAIRTNRPSFDHRWTSLLQNRARMSRPPSYRRGGATTVHRLTTFTLIRTRRSCLA